MGVYTRGNKLYLRIKGTDGAWKKIATGFADDTAGQASAAKMLADLERGVASGPSVRGPCKPVPKRSPQTNKALTPSWWSDDWLPRTGLIYAIALVPDLDPTRIKIGKSASFEKGHRRVDSYRTSNPTMELIAFWDTDDPDRDEVQALLIAASIGTPIGGEVFQIEDFVSCWQAIDRELDQRRFGRMLGIEE